MNTVASKQGASTELGTVVTEMDHPSRPGHSDSVGRQKREGGAYETVDDWSGVNMAVRAHDSTCYQPSLGWRPQDSCPEG